MARYWLRIGLTVGLNFLFSITSSADPNLHPNLKNTTKTTTEEAASEKVPQKKFFVEYLNYEEYAYSKSKKTELGDKVELDTALRYQFTDQTFGRFRFLTDPVENRFDNKTSKFEFLGGHVYENIYLQIDAELNTNEESNGGTSIGLDLDSDDTHIVYALGDSVSFTFFPFNFNGEVGREFNTYDVTRIYFVEGSPSSLSGPQVGSEKIAEKTIPGLGFAYKLNPHKEGGLVFRGAAGLATYLYPGDAGFDMSKAATANRWERREDVGYRASLEYRKPETIKAEAKYVGHTKSAETGSLLESAASVYTLIDAGALLIEAEATSTKAGAKPYRIDQSTNWFEVTSPYAPVYSDQYSAPQDWIGKVDQAYSLKVGMDLESSVPYLSYRRQGKHFIFRERESAHVLRTNDESQSHGGLDRYGLGAYFYKGNFVINPEVEYLVAKNKVFGSSTDVRSDRQLSRFVKDDFQVYLIVRYSFDGKQLFRP